MGKTESPLSSSSWTVFHVFISSAFLRQFHVVKSFLQSSTSFVHTTTVTFEFKKLNNDLLTSNLIRRLNFKTFSKISITNKIFQSLYYSTKWPKISRKKDKGWIIHLSKWSKSIVKFKFFPIAYYMHLY